MMSLTRIDDRFGRLRTVFKQPQKTKKRESPFVFTTFSPKQLKILTWWLPNSPVKHMDGIIADGAIRSGKTIAMSLSFCLWAMAAFDSQNFAMCGKTIGSFRRNVLFWLKLMLRGRGFSVRDMRSDNLLIVTKGGKTNYFYLFGGRDERSQDLIQGITLAGVFFDEVALMPESFVNQATGRCSVAGSKFWFNCNPSSPFHWFYLNWIKGAREKRLIHLHFTMDDNYSLSEQIKARYRGLYAGVFFKRYILGLWVLYDMFDPEKHVAEDKPRRYSMYYVSVDYGTQNAMVYLLWGQSGTTWYLVKEYYYDGRASGVQKTDLEYYQDLERFIGDLPVQGVIVDPSAASFIVQIKRGGKWPARKAKNDVDEGIRNTSTALLTGQILICENCKHTKEELQTYSWDEKAIEKGKEQPLKVNDHCADALRYFCNTILAKRGVTTW
jgi:PBSX family phage terminase large subunit